MESLSNLWRRSSSSSSATGLPSTPTSASTSDPRSQALMPQNSRSTQSQDPVSSRSSQQATASDAGQEEPSRQRRRTARAPNPIPFSDFSSPAVPNSAWCSENFMLGAGMVIFQPSTHRVVLLYDKRDKYWFFPRGRKDIGESLEATALREAYEESGYQVEFLPLYTYSHAPCPPNDPLARMRRNTEPIFTTVTVWKPEPRPVPGEYITFWYVGQIPHDAIHTKGTGMPDEQDYTSHLLTYEDARKLLWGPQGAVLDYAWLTYVESVNYDTEVANRQAPADAKPDDFEEAASASG